MECKNCKTVNSDDAVFCKNCGTRLDGKKNCPACGSVIDEDSVYCNACGARVDGKVVCKTCGTAYDGAYCPQCGNKTQAVVAKAERHTSATHGGAATKASKILNYVSLGLVIAVAVLSVIFVCLIGITLNASSEFSLGGDTSLGIFDYFSKEIQEVNDFFNAAGEIEYTAAYKASLYLPAVLGLISVIVSLVGTVAFAITGAVKSILNIVRKNEKTATVWALLAFVFYMFGASMIMSINAASFGATVSDATAGVSFNGATIAGIVICTVMVAGAVGCDMTVYFMKEKLSAFKIVGRVLAVAVAVGAVISVAMFASPVAAWINSMSYESMTAKTTTGMGLLGLFTLYFSFNNYATILPDDKVADLNSMETCVILGQLFIFIAVIAALLLLVTVLSKDSRKSRCLSIVSSGVFLASALIVLIVTVLAGDKFISAYSDYTADSYYKTANKMDYAAVIVALVFAALTFAGNICRVVFGAKDKGNKGNGESIEDKPEELSAVNAE